MVWFLIATAMCWLLSLAGFVGVVIGPGLFRRLRRFIAAVIFAGAGLLCAAVALFLHAFLAFSGETEVAQVSTRWVGPQEFELTYQPVGSDPGQMQRMRLRGDQWSVSGGIVKWHPWLTALGLKSYHRPMRLSGQFSRVAQQRAERPTVFLLAPEVDRVWEWFYQIDPYVPWIDAVYGSAASAYIEPDAVQEIAVTPSGYLIRRARPASRAPGPQ